METWTLIFIVPVAFMIVFHLVYITMVTNYIVSMYKSLNFSKSCFSFPFLLFSRQFKWRRWRRVIWRGCGEELVGSGGIWQQCWKWARHVPDAEEPINKVAILKQAVQDSNEFATEEASQGTRTWWLGMFICVKSFHCMLFDEIKICGASQYYFCNRKLF